MAEPVPQMTSEDYDQVFRPAKRRKQYRRRNDDDEEASRDLVQAPSAHQLPVLPQMEPFEQSPNRILQDQEIPTQLQDASLSELLRQRKILQRRKGGIEFTNRAEPSKRENALVVRNSRPTEQDEAAQEIEKVVNRFAPQTGQVTDVDKHMMAFIDSELAKRRYGQDPSQLSNGQTRETSPGGTIIDFGRHRQPAGLGKLHEIDLGEEARLRNISMTEAAKRRLETGEQVEEIVGKVRLGRDGKPRRGRKRRGSEDIKRDKLVEEVLKESKLEIYDDPDEVGGDGEEAADERIAEQFRRDFIDAMSNRRKRRSAAAKKPTHGAKEEEKARGPKLGGSRSARAAMRELEKAKEAKK